MVGNGAVVRGGDVLDFVKARLSHIISIKRGWPEDT